MKALGKKPPENRAGTCDCFCCENAEHYRTALLESAEKDEEFANVLEMKYNEFSKQVADITVCGIWLGFLLVTAEVLREKAKQARIIAGEVEG